MTYPGGVLLNKISKAGLLFGHLGPVPRDVAGARELGTDLVPATTLGFLHTIATLTRVEGIRRGRPKAAVVGET